MVEDTAVAAVASAAARRARTRPLGTVAVDMAAVEPAVRRVPNRLRDRAVAAQAEVAAAVRAVEAVRAAKAAEAADTVGATANPA